MYFVIQPLLVKKLCLYLIEISVEKVPAETHLQFLYRKKTSSVKCLFCIIILVITQGRLSNMKEKQVIICNCNIRLMQKYLYFCIVELCPLYWHTLFNKCDYVIHQKKKKKGFTAGVQRLPVGLGNQAPIVRGFVYLSGSHPGTIFHHLPTFKGQLTVSGDIFDCHSW